MMNADADVLKIDVGQVIRSRAPRLWRFLPRRLIRRLERLICQDDLNRLLTENAGKVNGEFCNGVLNSLNIKLNVVHPDRLPDKDHRQVVIVSNHPLGGLDGIALIDLFERHFGGQIWFIVNDLLMAVKPLEGVFLPINKFGRQSREAYKAIDDAFAGNDPILIFPAGMCSRLQTVRGEDGCLRRMVLDLPWKKMFVNKCAASGRDILPIFFRGENSPDFYKKANLRKACGLKFNLEQILLPREMIRSRGKSFSVIIGDIIPCRQIPSGHDAEDFTRKICNEVYNLAIRPEHT